MADEADIAERHERMAREAAISRALSRDESRQPFGQTPDGCCVDCGEPIAAARLAARPSAYRCTECQDAYERSRSWMIS